MENIENSLIKSCISEKYDIIKKSNELIRIMNQIDVCKSLELDKYRDNLIHIEDLADDIKHLVHCFFIKWTEIYILSKEDYSTNWKLNELNKTRELLSNYQKDGAIPLINNNYEELDKQILDVIDKVQ